MSLRKSPIRTAALLAACRANAQKSTGPRTPEGKARVRLNGLQHGRYCRKLHRLLPEGLSFSDRLRYNWIRRAIENCFRPATARQPERALRRAVEVWCQVAGAVGRSASGNLAENRRVREKYSPVLSPGRLRTTVPHSKQSLTFGTQAWGRRALLKPGERRSRAQAREKRRTQAWEVLAADLAPVTAPVAAASGRRSLGRPLQQRWALPGGIGTGGERVGGQRPPLQHGSALASASHRAFRHRFRKGRLFWPNCGITGMA